MTYFPHLPSHSSGTFSRKREKEVFAPATFVNRENFSQRDILLPLAGRDILLPLAGRDILLPLAGRDILLPLAGEGA